MSESRPTQAAASGPVSTWSLAERHLGEAARMSVEARTRAFTDSMHSYCDSCAHSRFIHSDDGSHCLYSECACARFKDQAPDGPQ